MAEKLEKQKENICLVFMAVYLFKLSMDSTMFAVSWPEHFEWFLRLLAVGAVLFRLGGLKKFQGAEWMLAALTLAAFGIPAALNHYYWLLDAPLLMLCAVGIPYKKILKVAFGVKTYVLLAAVTGSFAGVVRDLIYQDAAGALLKHAFGIVYPTDFAAFVFFWALTGWVLYAQYSLILSLFLEITASVLLYRFSGARNSAYLFILLALITVYLHVTERRSGRWVEWAERGLSLVTPVIAAVVLLITNGYDGGKKWMVQLNEWMSSRLMLGREAIEKHGLRLWGSEYDMYGAGGENLNSSEYLYNFLDCSYIMIAVRYGLILLVLVGVLYFWFVRKMLRAGQRRIAMAAALVAVHSIIEHRLLDIVYNVFLLIFFAEFAREESPQTVPGQNIKRDGILLAGAAACMLLFKPVMLCFRTAVQSLSVQGSTAVRTAFFGLLTIGLSVACGLCAELLQLLNKRKIHRKILVFSGSGLLFIVLADIMLISLGKTAYAGAIDRERDVLKELLQSESAFQVFVDDMSLVYMEEFDGISASLFREDGFAETGNVVLLSGKDREYAMLMNVGFSYAELSDLHGVYTNSEEAGQILRQAGYDVRDYCYTRHVLDPADIADVNDLEFTEKGLFLDGWEQSIWHGPGIMIFEGRIQVSFDLHLIGCENRERAATLRVTGRYGDCLLEEYVLTPADFDEMGDAVIHLTAEVPYNMSGMEFLLIAEGGTEINVREIAWQKIG